MAEPTDAAKQDWAEDVKWNPEETEAMQLTAEQQIRAKALECFTIAYAGSLSPGQPADFSHVQEFERYIREGK